MQVVSWAVLSKDLCRSGFWAVDSSMGMLVALHACLAMHTRMGKAKPCLRPKLDSHMWTNTLHNFTPTSILDESIRMVYTLKHGGPNAI